MGMVVNIRASSVFIKELKTLAKKYRSIACDVYALQEEIKNNPLIGDDLGNGVRKIRMAIKSKGKGKSSGARVITFNVEESTNEIKVTLLTIYDKSVIESVSDSYIDYLVGIAKKSVQ